MRILIIWAESINRYVGGSGHFWGLIYGIKSIGWQIKAIVPRYRYDQLMRLGWKWFLPFSLIWVVLVAFFAKFEMFGGAYARWAVGG